MRGLGTLIGIGVVVLSALAVVSVTTTAKAQEPAEPPGAVVDGAAGRGAYLVEHVAMCGQCHTPRTLDGDLDRSRWLDGAPVLIPNPFSRRPWAYRAPGIAGLVGYSEEEAVRLLTTGVARDGLPPDAPMPPFRMSPEDARAVVGYLMSLR